MEREGTVEDAPATTAPSTHFYNYPTNQPLQACWAKVQMGGVGGGVRIHQAGEGSQKRNQRQCHQPKPFPSIDLNVQNIVGRKANNIECTSKWWFPETHLGKLVMAGPFKLFTSQPWQRPCS
jgi:hypothetical protein